MAEVTHAAALNRGQFDRLIKVTRATSRYSERDVLLLMLTHKAGLRVTEASRVTVADVMFPSGKLREEMSLREAVTKNCKQRCAYLSNRDLVSALEAYVNYRLDKDIGTELDASKGYRGLLPDMPLIWSSRGGGMSQNTKRRILGSGEQKDYSASDSTQAHLSKLYRAAGIPLGSSHSGRRTFAQRVLEKTGDIEVVATLLGHESIDVSMRYLDVRDDVLLEMFANAI